jgi:hypothetical protein
LSVLVFNVTSSTDAFRPVRSRQRGYGTTQMTRYAAQAFQSQGLPKNIKYFCKEIFFALGYETVLSTVSISNLTLNLIRLLSKAVDGCRLWRWLHRRTGFSGWKVESVAWYLVHGRIIYG